MNLDSLKIEFIQYLEDKGEVSADEKLSPLDVSIFTYSSLFKDFLQEEGIIDITMASESLFDILKMNIDENGKIVEGEFQQQSEDGDIVDESQDNIPDEESQQQSLFTQIFNELVDDNDFFDTLDGDNDGKISQEDKNQFFNTIKNLDGNDEDISISDLLDASGLISENKFDELTDTTDTTDTTEEQTDNDITENTENTQSTQNIKPKSTQVSNYSAPKGNYGSANMPNNASQPKEKEKSLENMSKPELETELESAKSSLQEKEGLLASYTDDSAPELVSLKETVEQNYEAYKTQLDLVDTELAEQMEEIETAISEKENEIATQEQVITKQEVEYLEASNNYESATQKVASLEQLVSDLSNINKSGLSQEQISEIDSKLANAQEQLNTAKNEQSEALSNKSAKYDSLNTAKEKLKELKQGENGLQSLNESKQDLENTINEKHPQIKELMEAYNSSKSDYASQKDLLIKNAQDAVISAQNRINEVNSALNNVENKKTTKELSFNTLFSSDVKYNYTFVNDGNTIPYLLIGPENADPNQELPVLMYLHGSGEIGSYGDAMVNGSNPNLLPYNLLANENNYENFNGYIICPVLGGQYGNNWSNPSAVNNISNLLDNFSQSHKINEDKVAIAGHSLGAVGAEYIGYNLSSRFCSIGVLSGYSNSADVSKLDIPVYGFVGEYDDPNSYNYMVGTFANRVGDNNLYVQKNINHRQLPKSVYNMDADGNGHSDLFEMLFGDK